MHTKINNISELKKKLVENQEEAILLNSKDPFLSEYAKEHYNLLEYFTGFTGSNGYLLLTKAEQILITDGRYLEQAARQLDKSYTIFDIADIKKLKLTDGLLINFPALYFSVFEIDFFKKSLTNNVEFVSREIEYFKADKKIRMNFSSDVICLLDSETGESINDKLANLLKDLELKPNELYINADNSAISWLFNLRSYDIAFNPVICSYLLICNDKIRLFADFLDHERLTSQITGFDLEIISKSELGNVVPQLKHFIRNIKFDPKTTNFFFVDCFNDTSATHIKDPLIARKSIKNLCEIKNIKQAHRTDGVALTKFLYWLNMVKDKSKLSELIVAEKLAKFRIKSSSYMGPSFPTISGFAANGAIIHYKANKETNLFFTEASLLLLDSGGQYKFGTTDVTRTVAIGNPTSEMVKHFTLVLKGHIALSKLKFPNRNSGAALDSIARQFLWQEGLDYAHGTGHGVGYYLNVHEGPQSISTRSFDTALKAGMVVSNEPGFYKSGSYGIRIENLELVTKHNDEFLKFDTLTLAPMDYNLIDKSLLTKEEIKWYNDYHQRIIEEIGGKLSAEEIAWLKQHSL